MIGAKYTGNVCLAINSKWFSLQGNLWVNFFKILFSALQIKALNDYTFCFAILMLKASSDGEEDTT